MKVVTQNIRKEIETFPAMPALCRSFMTHLNDPNIHFEALVEELRYDPGMTANVLKLANSAYFGASEKVDSVLTAVTRLGTKNLIQLVMASGVSQALSGKLQGYDLRPEELLSHSVYVAIASEEMSKLLGLFSSEMLFTAGLLHDLGKIVLDKHMKLVMPRLGVRFRETNDSFDVVEEEVLGMSHAQVGGEILRRWNFPEELVAVAQWHHQPTRAGEWQQVAEMVHITDQLSYSEGIGTGIDGLRYKVSPETIAHLKLKTAMIERVASRSLEKVREMADILGHVQKSSQK